MKKMTINLNHMFSGALAFCSNMYPCTIKMTVLGHTYTFESAEAAFQAGKCLNPDDVERFTRVKNGAEAKRLGRRVRLRGDWDTYRIAWMGQVLRAKFNQNEELAKKLQDTYPLQLVETNTWNDTFWGVCDGVGENHLGKLLMEIREEKRPMTEPKGELDLMQFGTPGERTF